MVISPEIPVQESEKARVLVIDDELGQRESMRVLLKEKYRVHCVDRVEKGIAVLQEYEPDVIVMDIRMPEVDGIEGLRRIRHLDKTVSVIMLTGFGTLESARSAIRLGANDYLKKPFDTAEMIRVIADNVRRTDFSRRKAEAQQNLHQITESLMMELEQKRKMAKLGQASRELAHDLSNPLTVVISSVDLLARQLKTLEDKLQSSKQSETARDYIKVIEEGLGRCTELLRMWHNLGNKNDLALSACEVIPFLLKTRREAEAMVGERDIRLDFDLQDLDGVVIQADTMQLQRSLINLISNALDAVSANGGEVRVRASKTSQGIRLNISDNGPGIPPDLEGKVFEPYFTTKAEGKGTGLGLFISQRIIQRHGGCLMLDPLRGSGTSFGIELPFNPPAQDAPAC